MRLLCGVLACFATLPVFGLSLTFGSSQAFAFQSPDAIEIPAGDFIYGSDKKEREYAYQLDEKAYGHSITRKNGWYDSEPKRQKVFLPAFEISRTLVTNAQYGKFIKHTGHRKPFVDQKTWTSYKLVHPYARAQKFNWLSNDAPSNRIDHPVVLVSYQDATAYAAWISKQTGQYWHLPSTKQWQKAARGGDGRYFPWGNLFEASKLNSHDNGPFFTQSVFKHKNGKSPYGVLDMAGQVFEWTSFNTSSALPSAIAPKRQFVVGGSWDDKGCGVCRAAARHTRPVDLKHILIGFRLVRELSKERPKPQN